MDEAAIFFVPLTWHGQGIENVESGWYNPPMPGIWG
jgi:hypothetical protein